MRDVLRIIPSIGYTHDTHHLAFNVAVKRGCNTPLRESHQSSRDHLQNVQREKVLCDKWSLGPPSLLAVMADPGGRYQSQNHDTKEEVPS